MGLGNRHVLGLPLVKTTGQSCVPKTEAKQTPQMLTQIGLGTAKASRCSYVKRGGLGSCEARGMGEVSDIPLLITIVTLIGLRNTWWTSETHFWVCF